MGVRLEACEILILGLQIHNENADCTRMRMTVTKHIDNLSVDKLLMSRSMFIHKVGDSAVRVCNQDNPLYEF